MSENALDIFILEGIEDDKEQPQVNRMKSELKKDDPLRMGSMLDWFARQGGIDEERYNINAELTAFRMKKAKELTEIMMWLERFINTRIVWYIISNYELWGENMVKGKARAKKISKKLKVYEGKMGKAVY